MKREFIDRLNANKQILENLSKLVERYPTWRFGQILENFGVILTDCDMFYEESSVTLSRLTETMDLMQKEYGIDLHDA